MKKKNFRIGILVVTIAMTMLMVTGCNRQQQAAESGITELTIALWHYTTQPEFENTLNEYMRLNPNIRFDVIDLLTAGYEEQIITQLAGGRQIDILYIVNVPLHSQLIQAGQLHDLTDRVNRMSSAAGMRSALDAVQVDGRYYAIPWRQDFWPLFYNRDLFTANNEPLPENLTWEQYRDLAIRLTSGSGADKIYGSHLHTWNSITQSMSAVQLRANQITDDFSWLRHMYEVRLAMQNAGAIMDYGTIVAANVGYRPRFENQNAAMMIMGSWYIGELADRADFNWGIAPVPQMPGATEIRTMGNVTPVGIPIGARHVEEAWRFIEWSTGEAGAMILANVGIPSAFKNDMVTTTFFNLPGMPTDALSRRAFNPDSVSPEWPMHPLSGVIDSILNQEHQLILAGESSIDEGLRRMGERAAVELSR
jgi:multiple sugar transport system substrate-binding protein